jgi:NAD(P)-dependent dehydrogenase (short-subunit alcohol dehydrogenase family)
LNLKQMLSIMRSIRKSKSALKLNASQRQAVDQWQIDQIPDLSAKTVVITGANSGIGYEAALVFAQKHATVYLACRNAQKLDKAISKIKSIVPHAQLEALILDLSDLSSVQQASDFLKSKLTKIDILCNNAGVMAPPYQLTKDGFELQIGTNHFGHFAWTLNLMPLLLKGESRIVNISSMAHRGGEIDFDDLPKVENYEPWRAYFQSKLANLIFTMGLIQKLEQLKAKDPQLGLNIPKVVACHPGYSATELVNNGQKFYWHHRFVKPLINLANAIFGQSQKIGAMPTLMASTHPLVESGDYIGPKGFMLMRGLATWEVPDDKVYEQTTIDRLWALSEELTKTAWQF